MPVSRAANRARIEEDLLVAARAELAAVGPAALSLRAVARRLDVVPSALYRYVDGRDALLTRLVTDSYLRLGAAAEAADRAAKQRTPAERWIAVGRAARAWAVEHPSDWGLLYGTPVIGYEAPPDTLEPGTALVRILARIVGDAHPDATPVLPVGLPVPAELAAWLEVVGRVLPSVLPDGVVALAVIGFVQILGGISVELFGQYGADGTPAAAIFDHGLRLMATLLDLGPFT